MHLNPLIPEEIKEEKRQGTRRNWRGSTKSLPVSAVRG